MAVTEQFSLQRVVFSSTKTLECQLRRGELAFAFLFDIHVVVA